MKNIVLVLAASLLAGCVSDMACLDGVAVEDDPVMGNWAGDLPISEMPAMSLIFQRDAKGEPQAFVLYRFGDPFWCDDVKVKGCSFSLRHPYGQLVRGTVNGDVLHGEIAAVDRKTNVRSGDWIPFTAMRSPEITPARTDVAVLGEPIDLLKDGLSGWETMNPKAKFGWSFKDGVLSNKLGRKPDGSWAGGGANLRTKRSDFYDFNLEFDVRVPAKSNSGVYLRGRYEIQVVDSFGQPDDCHNMGAYYGRGTPWGAFEKPAGEWQHISVTLYKRHLTIELNGHRTFDNVHVTGVTGGAIDSNAFEPGPLYLQGDHSDADYKNMILRPIIK